MSTESVAHDGELADAVGWTTPADVGVDAASMAAALAPTDTDRAWAETLMESLDGVRTGVDAVAEGSRSGLADPFVRFDEDGIEMAVGAALGSDRVEDRLPADASAHERMRVHAACAEARRCAERARALLDRDAGDLALVSRLHCQGGARRSTMLMVRALGAAVSNDSDGAFVVPLRSGIIVYEWRANLLARLARLHAVLERGGLLRPGPGFPCRTGVYEIEHPALDPQGDFLSMFRRVRLPDGAARDLAGALPAAHRLAVEEAFVLVGAAVATQPPRLRPRPDEV